MMADDGAPARTLERTSTPARLSLVGLAGGYLILSTLAGVPMSPLTTPLPSGARPPLWATRLAGGAGLARLGRPAIIGVALVVMCSLLAAFTVLLVEAWGGRVRLAAVLSTAGAALIITTAGPLLLSRDVLSYAAYARVFAVYHRNPYVVPMALFRHDLFVSVTSRQWLRTRSQYGPVFSLIGALIVHLWPRPGETILAFKLLSGAAIAAATMCVVGAALKTSPERAPFAAAVLGLNPVIVIHTVGGGHVDTLVAALLAGALLIALSLGRPATIGVFSPGPTAVTLLLVLATLVRGQVVPALVLWLWWLVRETPLGHRLRVAAVQVTLVLVLSIGFFLPFLTGLGALRPIASLGGVESWASPTHLLAYGASELAGWFVGAAAGAAAERVIVVGFLIAYVVVFVRVGRSPELIRGPGESSALARAWGAVLLLLVLMWPYLLPWYAAWFLPFLGQLRDKAMIGVGVAVSGLLALTLIPADPFRGLTTWGVMTGVHYVVAPILLFLLVVAYIRVYRAEP